MTADSVYGFDRGFARERERLETQARFLDPGTRRLAEALGLQPGWRCAEIGAGTGTIATWLAERVAPSGGVVATDLDTRFLDGLAQPGLEIRRHDITAAPLEDGAYDLVHTRLLLMHLPAREQALRNMALSLRPGGWLLAEEYDLSSAGAFSPPSELQERVNCAVQRMFVRMGGDPFYGIKLLGALQRAGLRGVQAEARLPVVELGSERAEVLALKLEQFRARLLEDGLVTADELDRAVAEVRTPRPGGVHYQSLLVAAWGQKPA